MTAEIGGPRGVLIGARGLALFVNLGGAGTLVLLDLLSRASASDDRLVTQCASYRDLAGRLGLSKDTVGRAVRTMVRTGVIAAVSDAGAQSPFARRRYEVRAERWELAIVDELRR